MEAQRIWRVLPRQMASDLQRFFHRRIAEWHSGEMSSYELLELFGAAIVDDPAAKTRTIRFDFPPEDGAVAGELRGGERPEWKRMLAQIANETAVLRAAQVQGADADEYGSQLFLPMWREREFAADGERLTKERERLRSEGPDDDWGMASMWIQKEVSGGT